MTSRLNLEWCAILAVLLGLIGLSTWMSASDTGPRVGRLDAVMFDGLQQWASVPAAPDLIYIDIDDASIETIGPWPWPRARYAELMNQAMQAGARRVALDLLLPDPGRQDQALVDSLARWRERGQPLLLPVGRIETGSAPDAGADTNAGGLSSGPRLGTHLLPHSLFQRDAELAHAQFRIDPDGVVRGLNLQDHGLPAFALALHALPEPQRARILGASSAVWLPTIHGPIERLSAHDVLKTPPGPGRWKDRTILIGVSAAGLGDRFAHRLLGEHRLGPGAELHLAAFSAIAQQRLIRELPPFSGFFLSAALLCLQMLVLFRSSAWGGLAWTGGLLVVSTAIAWWGLTQSWWWAPSATLGALALSYPLLSWRRLAAVTRVLQRDAALLRESVQRSEVGLLPTALTRPQEVGASSAPLISRPLDPLIRDLDALDQAAQGTITLQSFLVQLIGTLPNPTLLVRNTGNVLIANPAWGTAFGPSPIKLADLRPASLALSAGRDGASFEYSDEQGRQWWLSRTQTTQPGLDLEVYQWVDITALSKAQREREQVLRFLSHDMRAPLVSMLAQLDDQQRVLRGGKLEDVQTQQLRLESLAQQTRQSLELADSFMQLTRAEAMPPSDEPVSLNFVMQQAIDACWERAQPKQLTLRALDELEALDQEAWIGGDAQLLRRALSNLIDNAIRYSPPGNTIEVTLTEEEAARPGTVAWYSLSVRDFGSGVAPEHLPRLFDTFWRAPGQSDYSGVGLGLAFVQRVAQHHGGRVNAQPRTPGIAFVLHLPGLEAVKSEQSIQVDSRPGPP